MQSDSVENILLGRLSDRTSGIENDISALRDISIKYPYFGAPNFLLAKKLQQQNDENFITVAQKTVLHFSNPLWLNFKLSTYDDNENLINSPVFNPDNLKEINVSDENQVPSNILISEDEIILANETTTQEDAFFTSIIEDEQQITKISESNKTLMDSNKDNDSKIASILNQQLKEFNKPISVEAEIDIPSEPYYRIDYFASQGIQLKVEDAEDKLGIRLRSFTGWLKQMKRISPQNVDLGTTLVDEVAVQVQAEHSNQNSEIVTEAMAEVLIKQGKIDQAIKVFEKLSFLDPSKSFYFAAQISNLKVK